MMTIISTTKRRLHSILAAEYPYTVRVIKSEIRFLELYL